MEIHLDIKNLENEFIGILSKKDEIYKEIISDSMDSPEEALEGIDEIFDLFNRFLNPLLQLSVVKISVDLEEFLKKYQNKIEEELNSIKTNLVIYKKICNSEFSISRYFKYIFLISGVLLTPHKKRRLRNAYKSLDDFSGKFENNIENSIHCWWYITDDLENFNNIPTETKNKAALLAKKLNRGKYAFNLTPDFYNTILENVDDQRIRQLFYRANAKIGSNYFKDYNNSRLIKKILRLRNLKSNLLGYENYAELAFANFSLPHPKYALSILDEIIINNQQAYLREKDELFTFMKASNTTTASDVIFYSQQLFCSKFGELQNESRRYFSIDSSLNGALLIAARLFNLRFVANHKSPRWDESVYYYDVFDDNGELSAGIYFDLYSRTNKRKGSWTDSCYEFKNHKFYGQSNPVAFVNCNFDLERLNIGVAHNELKILFHEIGHALHHILSKSNYAMLSGLRAYPWDLIEFPSFFFENYCWNSEVLIACSKNQFIENAFLDRLISSRNFQTSLTTLEEINYAYFDICIHQIPPPYKLYSVAKEVLNKTGIDKFLISPKFYNTFSHIFSGKYACSYYGYAFSRILANDIFSIFYHAGLFDRKLSGELVKNIYSSSATIDSFFDFIEKHSNNKNHFFLQKLKKISSPVIPGAFLE